MKRLFLLLALGITIESYAQPTLTNAVNYSIGDKTQYLECDSAGFNPGSNGAAQTWTFTSLTVTDTFTQEIVNPSSTGNGSQFPSATFAELSGNGEAYIENTGNDYKMAGIVESNSGLNMKYPNSMALIQRPVNYMDTLVDTFTSQYSYSSQSFTGGGVVTTIADGYGTLVLPDSTYNDVLRIRTVFMQEDSVSGFPIPLNVSIQNVTYMWFVAGFKEPILRADSFAIQTPGPPIETYTVAYRPKDQSVGITDIDVQNAGIYCHLSRGTATFAGKLNTGSKYNISMTDLNGRLIHNTSFTATSSEHTIDIPASLTDGVYIIGIQENDKPAGYIKSILQ